MRVAHRDNPFARLRPAARPTPYLPSMWLFWRWSHSDAFRLPLPERRRRGIDRGKAGLGAASVCWEAMERRQVRRSEYGRA